MHLDPLLPSLVGIALAILFGGLIIRRLGQPHVVGYLITGVVIGPAGLGWIADTELVGHLGAVGVVLLLFFVGMEASPRQLIAKRRESTVRGRLPRRRGTTDSRRLRHSLALRARKMVEAAGIEPASRDTPTKASTCVGRCSDLASRVAHDQGSRSASPTKSHGAPAEARSVPSEPVLLIDVAAPRRRGDIDVVT